MALYEVEIPSCENDDREIVEFYLIEGHDSKCEEICHTRDTL
jgi:hypothetical protein